MCRVAVVLMSTAMIGVSEAARPQYGGTLRVETALLMRGLDPAVPPADAAEQILRAGVIPLMFESLVVLDPAGGLRPGLATTWEHDDRAARWRFQLRPAVRLHDGSLLQAAQAASILGAVEPGWHTGSSGNTIVIDTDGPHPDLPWELADPHFAIVVRTAAGDLVGTGPFRIDRFEPRRFVLRAFDDHWAARPFVDTVQIDQGRPLADQLASVEAGRADIVAVRPTDLRRLAQRRLRSLSSRPLELFAIAFEPHRSGAVDEPVRHTLAAAIDRTALANVLLQRQGEPARTLVPPWLSGYAPEFVADRREPISRASATALPAERRTLILRVDPTDSLATDIAARVAVDAREAGIVVTVQAPTGLAPRPDARLIRVRLHPTTPDRALAAALGGLGPRVPALIAGAPSLSAGAPLETVLAVERTALETAMIVPLVHVRDVYAVGERVDSWNEPMILPSGAWNLAGVWVKAVPPSRPSKAGAPGAPGER